MAKEKVLLFVLLFFIQGTLIAQVKVSNLDFNYWYNETPGVKGEILAAREDSSALLLVRIDASLDSLRKYELTYSLVNSLDDNISSRYQLAPISTYFQYEDNQSSYYGIKVILKDAKFFVLWFSDLQRHISYPIVKKLPEPKSPAELVMYRKYFNAPIVSNYITQGTEVRVRPLDGIPTNLNVNYYDYHFQPAMPPMSQVPGSDSTNFTADLSYRIVTDDTLVFQNNGLYYLAIQGAKIGRSVIVTNDQFPGTNSFEQLVDNLRYLTTDEEWEKLSSSFDKKEMFDKFWLNNTMSEDRARVSVREYYRRVRAANAYFTCYKEGWKTDRGMIYIVFGPPSHVFIRDDIEMWIYEKSFELPRVAFNFTKINTAFTNQHYVLVRKAEYQNLWFRVVDLWRKGKKEF